MATITKTQQGKAGATKKTKKKFKMVVHSHAARLVEANVEMALAAGPSGERTPLGQALEQGLREAVSIAKGEADAPRRFSLTEFRNAFVHKAFGPVEIRDLRKKLGLSQSMLAAVMDLTPRSVTNWEQGLRTPDGPSRRMLQLLEVKPEVLKFLLGEATTGSPTK